MSVMNCLRVSASSLVMRVVTVLSEFTNQNYWELVLVPKMNEAICVLHNNQKNVVQDMFLGEQVEMYCLALMVNLYTSGQHMRAMN